MRPAAVLAATLALAGCAGLLGPGPEDVQAGLAGYRAREAEMQKLSAAWPATNPELAGARLDRIGDCGPLGAYFICDGTFVLADGSARHVDLWLTRMEGQWRLNQIVPKELTP